MVALLELIIFGFIFLIVATIYWYATIPKNLPPGPLGLPFIGSSLAYRDGAKEQQSVLELINKYGPISKLYIGNKLVVVLGDYDSIHEAMVKQADVFSGRPQVFAFFPEKTWGHGVILSEGDLWKEHRRFALSTLRDFGVGRPLLEQRIKEEMDYMNERLDEFAKRATPFDPQRLLICVVSNVISQMIFGHRFSYDDDEFVQYFLLLSKRASGSGVGFLTPQFLSNTLATLMAHLPMVRKLKMEADDFLNYCERQIEISKKTFDADSEPSNYVHAYMKTAAREIQTSKYFSDRQLLCMVNDLFMAATETTSTQIRWALLYLGRYPEIQEKMHREIKEQVGTNVAPGYADRVKLPYCDAVLMELQRISNLVPSGVLRRSLAKTKLMGYDIPEDTIVMPFLTNVLLNAKDFEEPRQFKPERFIDGQGKVIRDPKLIPFQAGKRICLGEPLARMELFILLVGLIGRYRFYFVGEMPSTKAITGLTSTPEPYEIMVEARND